MRGHPACEQQSWGLAQKAGTEDPVAAMKTQTHLLFGYSLAVALD